MPRVRGRSNASSLTAVYTFDADDPLSRALLPPADESPAEREERLRAEREAKRVSDEIDDEIRKERAALKRKRPVRVLLLGQSESGKSTTLKNFQIHYAPQAWREERACWRAVVQLNLIRSVSLVLDAIATAPPPMPPPPSDPSAPATPTPAALVARYAPLVARLSVAERILQRRLSPTDADEPGDYRSFAATDSPPSLVTTPLSPTASQSPSSPSVSPIATRSAGQEFFVRASGVTSWKTRFLRKVSTTGASTSTPGSPSLAQAQLQGSPSASPRSTMDHPLRPSLDLTRSNVKSSFSKTTNNASLGDSPGDDDSPSSPTFILHAALPEMRALWRDRDVRAALARAEGRVGGLEGVSAAVVIGGGWAPLRGRVEDMPGFFLNDVDRIAARGYEPSDDDVIRARLRTMGVQEHRFTFERGVDTGREWRVYDVGGARSQATSWLSFFDDMDAIIFLAPISCFDETLAEDRRINRLEDSITLWRTLCRSPLLARVQLVLFLNKVDLLRRKIANGSRIARHVTSFGDRMNDVETVCKYFKQKFKEIQRQYSPEPRPYYVYFTSVTDTRATGITLGIVREGILRANLQKADFL